GVLDRGRGLDERLVAGRGVAERVFAGGRAAPELVLEVDEVLVLLAADDVRELLDLTRELVALDRLGVERDLQVLQLERERQDLAVALGQPVALGRGPAALA